MKLLVTGGAGFIGSNFISYCLEKYPDHQIKNLDLLTYAGNLDNLSGLSNNPRYEFIHGDICDSKLVSEIVKDVDLIVHFAAESHVDRSIKDSGAFIKTNVEGTRVLLEAARLAKPQGLRFHHVSTDEVFGSLEFNEQKFSELRAYDPRSPYSASKAASDHLVRAYFHTYNLPITISNCSNNYGPYQHPEKLIPLFITNLLENKPLPVYGSGRNVRDWIHVADHNRGLDLIINRGRIGETYCLGGASEKSNLEITNEILEIMGFGQEMITYVTDRPGHDLRYAIDFTKAQQELGYAPQYSFMTGIRETIKWYKNYTKWWQKLKN
jgi:dTDP-glucose 4,6-dehydratase